MLIGSKGRNHAADAVACGLLAAVSLCLYRDVLRISWTYDDAYLLHLAMTTRIRQYFWDPGLWHALPGGMFVPLLPVTYEVALAVFGLTSSAWHGSALVFVFILSAAWYGVLRLWLPVQFALIGGLLLILAVPLCSVAAQLMLIHYLESLILVCASVILHVYNLRRPSRAAAWLSAGAYFAAMLAKEIAAPLILLLALLPGKDFHRSLKAVAPHGCALLVYLIWRYIMLGTLFGGYGWAIERREYLSVLTSLPRKLLLACTGPETWTGALFAALILFGLVAVLRDQPIRILAIVGVVALLAPVIPVSKEFQPRYALPLWVGMTALFATSCNRLQTRRLSAALSVTALLLALVCNRQAWALEYASDARMTAEANAFLKLSGNALLRTPAIPPAALNELNWLKQEQEQRPSTNGWFYDDLFLCEGGGDGKRVWQYDSNARQVIEVTQRLPDLKAAYCGTIRPDSRLSTEFHFRGGTLSWNFGPYGDGSWRVLFGEGAQAFDVPREGAFRLGDISGMAVRIRYSSPAGWVTYSPVLMLDFAHHRDFEWHR